MKRFFGFLALLCLFFRVGAQEHINNNKVNNSVRGGVALLKPLRIGERLPDVGGLKVLNNGGGVLKLSDYKGRLLILDFWATSCSGCIQGMPRLDSLGKAFGDRVAILPVTYEKADAVVRFQGANAFLKGRGVSKFWTVVEDKVLHKLFPHRLLPHEVWISGDGVVLGFTDGIDVTAKNISAVLAGGALPVPEKRDVLDYDKSKMLMVNGNGAPDSAFAYRSIFSGEIRGINSGLELERDTVRRVVHVRATNVDVRYLYILAFKELRFVPRASVDVALRPGLFCYEMTMPLAPAGIVREAVRRDLDRFLGVRSVLDSAGFRLLAVPENDGLHEPLSL
jgi:thiol-disulfide isomerase/thioredoxin